MGRKLTETIETVDPRRIVAGAVAQDGVARQVVAQPNHDRAEIDATRLLGRHLRPCEKVRVGRVRSRAPRNRVGRLHRVGRFGKRRRARMDCEMRPVEPPELLGARMDVHELGLRSGNVEQAVALRRELAEPTADEEDEVGLFDARH